MDNSQPVRLIWNEKDKNGTLTLILKNSIINKYSTVLFLHGHHKESDIGFLTYPITSKKDFDLLKIELNNFKRIINDYKLTKDTESPFHESHLLHIVQEFNTKQNLYESQRHRTYRLHNRIELLKELNTLTRDNECNYDITISKKGRSDFKYTFSGEELLKKHVLRYLTGEIKSNLKTVYKEIWGKHNDSWKSFDNATLDGITDYEINQMATSNVAKKIVDYLNNETIALKNKRKASDGFSVTNKQGEFIYDILTLFGAYAPQNRKVNEDVKVTHHSAIRKLILKYANDFEAS